MNSTIMRSQLTTTLVFGCHHRLDWQMWFAALGNPQSSSNLWFLRLFQKLLDDCSAVQHLVGDPQLLSGRKLSKIRAKLYHYDFTRLDTEWNRAIPGTRLTNSTSIFRQPDQYWYRQFSRMYLGEFGKENRHTLDKHLSSHRFTRDCESGTDYQCRNLHNQWCFVTFCLRKYNLHLVPVLLLYLCLLLRGLKEVISCRRHSTPAPPSVSGTKKNQ